MGFLAPFMLWGAAAASIPIALHFFFRSRYRTVPWAAMKFLLTSIEQTSRRLRFQELLLLLVRVALLVLLAIALARPLSSSIGGGSGRDAIDAAFVIDNSMSMGVREADKTRLDVARAAALSALDHLPPHSTVQVITCSDSATLLGPRQTGNLDQARDLIQAIELTSQATDLEPGVRKAVDHLKTSGSPNKELYLFSDMQKSGWEAREGALKEKFKEFHEKGVLYMVRCGIDVPRNVSIIEIVPQSSNTKPGERVGFAVMVRNTGNEVVKNLTVTLNIDNRPKDEEAQLIPEVKPAETRIVILTGKIDKTGLRVVKATVKQDDLEADNSLYQVIQVREQLRILAIDGRPAKEQEKADQASSFYFLHWLALLGDQARGHYNLRVKVTTPRQASKDFFNESDLCVLFNVGVEKDTKKGFEYLPERFPEELAKWVEQGGGLLIFAGDNVMPEAYNRILGKREGILPLPIAGVRITDRAFLVHDQVTLIEGRPPRSGEVIVGRLVHRQMGVPESALAVGEKIRFEGGVFTISGRFAAPGTTMEAEIWTSLTELRALTKRDDSSVVFVRVADPSTFAELELFAKRRLDLELVMIRSSTYYRELADYFRPIQKLAWVMAVLIAGAALFGGANTLNAAVQDRIRELASLRAVGYTGFALVRALTQESLVIAAIGGVMGLVFARLFLTGGAVRIAMSAFRLDVDAVCILIAFGGVLVLGFLGTAPAAIRVLRMPVAAALKEP